MNYMKTGAFCFALLFTFACAKYPQAAVVVPANQLAEPIVKQSKSGICHDRASGSYKRTKSFTPYATMQLCVESGGNPYKSYKTQFDLAEQEARDEGRAFVSLYNRKDWPHWIDADKDCQNTRHELLIAGSTKTTKYKSLKECQVLAGSWFDPYSGFTYTNSKELDLDHIVPLKFAHGHGGDVWTRERKQSFANDTENLILAQASLNRQKGAKGLDEWLPPNLQYRCEYISRFNNVMTKYELNYIPSEQQIVNTLLEGCGSQLIERTINVGN